MANQHRPSVNNSGLRWLLAPLRSRGEFSPRLLMAWQAFYMACFLAYRYTQARTEVVAGVLIQPSSIVVELCGIFVALVGALLSLGTLQKIRLDGPPPEPDQYNPTNVNAPTANVSGQNVSVNSATAAVADVSLPQ